MLAGADPAKVVGMGKLISLGVRSVVVAAGAATVEIYGDGTFKPRVRRVQFSQVTAVAGSYGFGLSAAKGVTPTALTPLNERAWTYAPKTRLAVAWGTPPTVPASFYRRATAAAVIGDGADWDFGPEGLQIDDAATSLVLWVIATAPVLDVNIIVEE